MNVVDEENEIEVLGDRSKEIRQKTVDMKKIGSMDEYNGIEEVDSYPVKDPKGLVNAINYELYAEGRWTKNRNSK
jgi:hypothetical protein